MLAGGDDVAFNAAMAPILMAQPGEGMRHFVRHLAEDLPVRRRVGRIDPGAAPTRAWTRRSSSGHCEVAARLARRLGLDDAVCDALAHAFERWDGKGHPAGLAGEEVPVAVRIVAAARDAELFERRAGWPAAVDVLSRRRGHGYDPRSSTCSWPAGSGGWPRSATTRAPGCSMSSRDRCGRSPPTSSTPR